MGVYKNVLKDFQTFLKVFRGVAIETFTKFQSWI